jgi:hypothetical protein
LLASCSDDRGSAGPNGGAGGSGGSAAGAGGSSGSGGSGGSAGACTANAPSIARAGATVEVPTLVETAPKRNPDVAHDPVSDVYLVVAGAAVVSATFLDDSGQSLAPPFAVAQTSAYTQTPRVTHGAGKLLVAWHDGRTEPAPQLRARIVSWNGSAPDLALPDFAISEGTQSYQEMGPALAYSETSGLFLVVWQSVPGDDLSARRVDASGSPIGAEIQLTSDADWQSGAGAAWSSARDEFLVTWTHAGAAGAAVRSRRIRASDGSLLDSEIELAAAPGTWTTQVTYLPCEDRYVVGWVTGGGTAFGLRLDASGAPDGAPFGFPSGYGYPEGFALAPQPLVRTVAAVMHGPTDEDFAVAFASSGEQSAVLQATDEPGDQGHFNPRIAANALRNEWLLVTSHGFETLVAQRLAP